MDWGPIMLNEVTTCRLANWCLTQAAAVEASLAVMAAERLRADREGGPGSVSLPMPIEELREWYTGAHELSSELDGGAVLDEPWHTGQDSEAVFGHEASTFSKIMTGISGLVFLATLLCMPVTAVFYFFTPIVGLSDS